MNKTLRTKDHLATCSANYSRLRKILNGFKHDIYNFEIIDFASPYVEFKIECSKGTYIRSIANDFGKRLNSGSYLYELRRTKIGDFSVLNAMDIK